MEAALDEFRFGDIDVMVRGMHVCTCNLRVVPLNASVCDSVHPRMPHLIEI